MNPQVRSRPVRSLSGRLIPNKEGLREGYDCLDGVVLGTYLDYLALLPLGTVNVVLYDRIPSGKNKRKG